jgi:hypothetical protein
MDAQPGICHHEAETAASLARSSDGSTGERIMTLPRLLGALVLIATPLAACASSTSGGGGTGASTGGTVTTDSVCATDPRATPYSAGLSATATSGSKLSILTADPAPPVTGENTWTIKLTDATGAPMSGATIALKPYMPDHGHGSSIVPQVSAMPADGTYQVKLIDLFMPGIWENTFTITPASGPVETVVFTFCVDG